MTFSVIVKMTLGTMMLSHNDKNKTLNIMTLSIIIKTRHST
jgi:hypothetical protein